MRILKDLVAVIRRITIICLIYAQSYIWASPFIKCKPPVPTLNWKPVSINTFKVRLEATLKNLARLRKIIKEKIHEKKPQTRKTKTLRRLEKLEKKKIRKELKSCNVTLSISISTLTECFMKTFNILIGLVWRLFESMFLMPTKKKSEDLPTKKKSEDFYPLKARPSTNQQKGINFDI